MLKKLNSHYSPEKDKQPNLPPIRCNNCHLDKTETYVYLGVDIQNNLSVLNFRGLNASIFVSFLLDWLKISR